MQGTKRNRAESTALGGATLGTPGRIVGKPSRLASSKKASAAGDARSGRITGSFTGRACTSLFDLARCLDECRDWNFPRR